MLVRPSRAVTLWPGPLPPSAVPYCSRESGQLHCVPGHVRHSVLHHVPHYPPQSHLLPVSTSSIPFTGTVRDLGRPSLRPPSVWRRPAPPRARRQPRGPWSWVRLDRDLATGCISCRGQNRHRRPRTTRKSAPELPDGPGLSYCLWQMLAFLFTTPKESGSCT
jgi:hypothetical protein